MPGDLLGLPTLLIGPSALLLDQAFLLLHLEVGVRVARQAHRRLSRRMLSSPHTASAQTWHTPMANVPHSHNGHNPLSPLACTRQ